MARSAREARPLAFLWRPFRRDDDGATTIASFVVATAVFILSTTVLIHFVARPPGQTAGLEVASLKARGFEALDVLLGTP
ncbi:MAG TPA: hypothetical protein VNX21_01805, partial [Candidatus Thermoplasmatota archaeon]|nr:hypothetical protein [Candidatus Thermoplasmatota archaeon]